MDESRLGEVKRLVAMFGEHLEREGYSPVTWRGYRHHLRFFIEFLSVDDAESLAGVTPETIHRYQVHLHTRRYRDRPTTLETQYARLVALQSFFRWLVRRGHVLADPLSALEIPRRKKSLPKGLMTGKEIHKVLARPNLDRPTGLRDRAILEVLYSTAIRNGELCRLTLIDVDTANGEVCVRKGKGGRDRVVPLGGMAAHYVETYIREARPRLARESNPTTTLFLTVNGRSLSVDRLARCVKAYGRRAGIGKVITPHSFRHTCATHMLKGRASLRHVQELLGHKNINTTQIYTHVTVSDLKKEHHRCHPREHAAL